MAFALLIIQPAAALAVFPGENGKILFVTGIGDPANDDSSDDLYILDAPNGAIHLVDNRSGQHRHPAWSPTLTRVAYALWDVCSLGQCSNEKVWVQDLATHQIDRLGPSASNVKDDRPSWSPDGTKIAYESEVTDGSGQMDILITDISQSVTPGSTTNLTQTSNCIEGKPVWSRDGKWIYYSRRCNGSMDDDILKEKSDNSSGFASFVVNSAFAEYQPALSPDNTHLCYTRGPYGSASASVFVLDLSQSGPGFDLGDSSAGTYNCAWSPGGGSIAYVRGPFTSGALMYERADDSGQAQFLTTDTPNHFDGNADWAPLHPAFCAGRAITIAGTDHHDTIYGTPGRDVINAFGGGDTIRPGGGSDVVCGGSGKDDIHGGPGNDILYGQADDDALDGGPGTDLCNGGPGADTKTNCEP